MTTTIEYVRFEASDAEELTARRDGLVALLGERYGTDFLGGYLARCEDGSLVDFLLWASPEAAARAAREMPGDPAAAGFFGLIGDVHEMRHAEVLHTARPRP
ncbi:hypothetical protein GCM10023347_46970 [Streptomyces chumphonensis]|uniref:ABM domain-containing protein n=1 Tax=Streptomyces chumphonensis TaxID=1214925 RepID=A0A927EZL0_9ACTN|nr:hypothetical protein [Streptomyces chumphonensis]MBD3932874.1 hypothetical protein [Streptomyces chumphonensis]